MLRIVVIVTVEHSRKQTRLEERPPSGGEALSIQNALQLISYLSYHGPCRWRPPRLMFLCRVLGLISHEAPSQKHSLPSKHHGSSQKNQKPYNLPKTEES